MEQVYTEDKIMCSYSNTPGPLPKIPIYTVLDASPGDQIDPIKNEIDEYFASTYVLLFSFHL